MQAHANGEKIEEMDRFAVGGWRPFQGTWNWAYLTFRIAPEPKKEGRWERVEIALSNNDAYRIRGDAYGSQPVDALLRIPGFGGIDYRSPFDPKVIVRSMVPVMFRESSKTAFVICEQTESCRPGIPVAAWFWKEGEK